jgi:RHS repeat-associated protein
MRAVRRLIAGLVGIAFWSLRLCSQRHGRRFGRGVAVGILAILLSGTFGSSLALAVPSTAIRYFYTPNNRLSAVIKPEAEYALYTWDAAGNLSSIKRASSTKLSVIQLEPTKGAVGETVDIWGTGFSTTPGNDTVKFHGTAATVTAATADALAVKVPSGVTTGTVTVQTTTEGPVTSAQTFTVGSATAPTITSLSTSVAAAGTTVTVTGTNFETHTDNDYVTVNQTMAEVVSSTNTSLKFVVPEATSSGKVSVSTPFGAAVGPYLYIPPPGYTTTQIGPTANMTLSSASTLSITAAKTVGLATIEATGGEMLSNVLNNITIASGTAYVYSPRDEEIASRTFSSSEERLIEPVTLPSTGTYTVLIAPSGEDTGKLEVTPYYADTVTGTLNPTTEGATKSVSLPTPGQKAKYTVSGSAGEEVSIRVSEFAFPKEAWLEWFNAEGKNIGEKGFTGTGFMESVVLPATGTYTLVVNPYYPANIGSMKFTAFNSTVVTGSITPTTSGESKTVTTSVPGQYATVTFSGSANEEVSLVFSESTIKSGSVVVLSPEGYEVAPSNESLGTSTMMDGTHGALVLPKTGTYTIRIKPSGEETGSVKLTAYKANEVTGLISPTTSGAEETVSISIPGQKAKYTVSGTAGEEVTAHVSEFTFAKEAWVEWFNAEGKNIGEKGFTGTGFMESVVFPSTGTYYLVVNPYGMNTGGLKIKVYNATAVTGSTTPTSGGESKTVTTTVPGQGAKITFSGTAGEEVALELSESTIKAGTMKLLTSEGSEVSSSRVSFGTSTVLDGERFPLVLPKTGTYTIQLEVPGEETGSVKLTAYNATEKTGSISPTTSGAEETVSIPAADQRAKYSVSVTAGEEVSIGVSEFTFPKETWLEWFNPEGKDLAEKGFTGSGFMESYAFPTTGTYSLLVNPNGGFNTGSVKLKVYNSTAVTGSITPTSGGESKTVTTTVPGQKAKITFSGSSSEEVSLVLAESTIKSGHVLIDNSEGSRVGEEKAFSSSGETTLGPVSLSATGTYTIVIKPEGEYTGSVKLTAYKGSPPHGLVIRKTPGGTTVMTAWESSAPAGGGLLGARTLDTAATRVRHAALPSRLILSRSRHGSSPRRLLAPTHQQERGAASAGGSKASQSAVAAPRIGEARRILPPAVRSFRAPMAWATWYPHARGGGMAWSTGLPASPWEKLAFPAGTPGISSVAGQALMLNGLPLAGLRVSVQGTSQSALTDSAGQFVLKGVPAGHQVLVIDGGRIGGVRYGTFAIGLQVAAHAQTALDAPIWMTPLDLSGDHRIASPTTKETRITTPRIPGLEVRLPAGTVIHDAAGHIVHSLNITAIPVDRPPFPLPFFIEVPVYFTVQPGRAYLSKGAQIVYPNYTHLRPGTRVAFWNYDPSGRGWYVYGHGSVTPNGKQVIPDPGVRVWEFTGSMITGTPSPPSSGSAPGGSLESGDPVDLSTGLFDYTKTDLTIPDTIPIVIERSYRQGDSNSYSFGIGTTNRYDLRLWSENNYHEADLILPDGGRVLYKRVSAGEGYKEAEYKATNTPSVFYDSTITWNESVPGWDLTLTNGTTYVFGELAPLQAIRNKQGQQLTITRSNGQKGNITQITSPHGRWVKFTYNSSNDITEIKDNAGRTLKYKYTTGGLLESATDPAEHTTKYEYNSENEMKSITDPRGNKYIENEYESHGRIAKQKMANGGVFEFNYTTSGEGKVEATTVTEPRETKRKVTFNSEGYQISEILALGTSIEQKTTMERQANTGFLLLSTDPRSRKTSYEYDSYGNVTSITHLAGTSSAQTYKYTYESSTNELTKETDPLGHSTSYEYNSLGELTAKKDALGHTTHYEYNGDGQVSVITDPMGHKTTIAYERGEPVSVTDPLGRTTKQFVDVAGRVVSTTAPGGQRTTNEYNNDNQLLKTIDPAGDETAYEYDSDGDLIAVTDPLKHKTTLAYTKMDLLESEEDPLEKKTVVVYDTEGNLVELTDRRGKVDKFTYDALNRLTEAKYGVSGETAESTIKYEYDNGNRLTKVVDSASGTYTPEYDELNRLTSLVTPQGTLKYEYDEANRRTSMTVPGQEAVKYTYDEANRLKEIKRGTQAVAFAYNEDNLPTSTTLPDGIEEQYGYDEANELTLIAYKKSSTTLGELAYSYDLDGRKEAVWGSYARTNLPEAFSSAKYNADDEQTERGSKKFSYDANGNLTSDGTNEYTWNARNQLASITGGTKASFSYSPFGQRVSRTLSGTTTELLSDGPNVVQEIQGGKAIANLLTGLLPSSVFTRATSKTTENLLTDQLGSTIALANSSGSIETDYTYDPFGTTTKEGTASENTIQYAGQENDGDGLYYDRARYYSPAAARFISQDPLGQNGGGPDLYLYTSDGPTDAIDPYGTTACHSGLKGESLSEDGTFTHCRNIEESNKREEENRHRKEEEHRRKEEEEKFLCGNGGTFVMAVVSFTNSSCGGSPEEWTPADSTPLMPTPPPQPSPGWGPSLPSIPSIPSLPVQPAPGLG